MKITNFKKGISWLAVATILFSAVPAYAQNPGGEGYEHERPYGERKDEIKKARENLVKELGITPEQEELLKKHRREHRDKMRELVAKVQTGRVELRLELEKYDPNENKINDLASELKSIHSQLLDLRIANIAGVKSILTQEQFEEFKDKIYAHFGKKAKRKFWERMRERCGGGKGRPHSQYEGSQAS